MKTDKDMVLANDGNSHSLSTYYVLGALDMFL